VSRVRSTLDLHGLAELASAQVNSLFPDGSPVAATDLLPSAARALQRLEHCFVHINNKYFFDGQQAVFDHLHGDQYAMWLYFLSNQLHLDGGAPAASKKLFLLNKALHGCDIFYEIALPSIFLLVHPLGTVLGRASYQDYLLVYQRVGIGSNHDIYPQLGHHLTLRPGSSVLGKARVGDHCSVAAESLVLDRDLPDHSLYIGSPREYIIHHRELVQTIWKA
jgi:serine O-acetyltransferase